MCAVMIAGLGASKSLIVCGYGFAGFAFFVFLGGWRTLIFGRPACAGNYIYCAASSIVYGHFSKSCLYANQPRTSAFPCSNSSSSSKTPAFVADASSAFVAYHAFDQTDTTSTHSHFYWSITST